MGKYQDGPTCLSVAAMCLYWKFGQSWETTFHFGPWLKCGNFTPLIPETLATDRMVAQGFLCAFPIPFLGSSHPTFYKCRRKIKSHSSCNELSTYCIWGTVLKVIYTHLLTLTTCEVSTTFISVWQRRRLWNHKPCRMAVWLGPRPLSKAVFSAFTEAPKGTVPPLCMTVI